MVRDCSNNWVFFNLLVLGASVYVAEKNDFSCMVILKTVRDIGERFQRSAERKTGDDLSLSTLKFL